MYGQEHEEEQPVDGEELEEMEEAAEDEALQLKN